MRLITHAHFYQCNDSCTQHIVLHSMLLYWLLQFSAMCQYNDDDDDDNDDDDNDDDNDKS